MAQQEVHNLMTELHELFGNEEPSAGQQQLMESLEYYIHNNTDAAPPDPTPLDTIELLVDQIEVEHPRASGVLRQLMSHLRNMGV